MTAAMLHLPCRRAGAPEAAGAVAGCSNVAPTLLREASVRL